MNVLHEIGEPQTNQARKYEHTGNANAVHTAEMKADDEEYSKGQGEKAQSASKRHRDFPKQH